MLLPEKKEREYRFRLALRIGLPIFALVLALISSTLITTYESLHSSFYFEAILLLAFSIYFIFYLIYKGFAVKITDDVSKAFTREYLYEYINKELEIVESYTLILITIENLHDINKVYGIKNGDKTLLEVATWISNYLQAQGVGNFPIGHIKGGDFIIGLRGNKAKYSTILDLMCLKSTEFHIDNIELKITGAITDTNYSNELHYMIEHLFELQEIKKREKSLYSEESMDPTELESLVINAIKNRKLSINSQEVQSKDPSLLKECFFKLKRDDGKYLYPKSYKKVINKLGLSVEYDQLLIQEIIDNCSADDQSIYAVNISPSSLRNHDFLLYIKSVLKEYQSLEFRFMFILSEQEYYSFTSRYNSILNSLKGFGVLFCIDRLGALHTSFLYLRELNIDYVRFDTYYSNKQKIEENSSIMEGFKIMAQEKGIKTWVKNIEDEETLLLVKKIGVDCYQGRHIAELTKVYDS